MPSFNGDAFSTYGGGLFDYSPVVDPTRDRPAAGANAAYTATAEMTLTAVRARATFTVNGAVAPVLVSHNALWGNSLAVAPVPVRTSAGIYTVTWPTTVQNQITIGTPGYTGPLPLNLVSGWANLQVVATAFDLFVVLTSANVATVKCFSVAGSLADPSVATNIDVFVAG